MADTYDDQRGTICASCGRYVTLPPGKDCDAPEDHAEPAPERVPLPAMVPTAEVDFYRDELLRAHRTIGALQAQLEQARGDLERTADQLREAQANACPSPLLHVQHSLRR